MSNQREKYQDDFNYWSYPVALQKLNGCFEDVKEDRAEWIRKGSTGMKKGGDRTKEKRQARFDSWERRNGLRQICNVLGITTGAIQGENVIENWRKSKLPEKYQALTPHELVSTGLTLFFDHERLRTIKQPPDFLRLAFDVFHGKGTTTRKVGKHIKGRVELFEKKDYRRVVMQGHGVYDFDRRPIQVPEGKTIHFYVPAGQPLTCEVSQRVEGWTQGEQDTPEPYESCGPGALIEDYFLGYPREGSGVKLNAQGMDLRFDWICVNDQHRWIPLSSLFKDPRCVAATDIHWCACRSRLKKSLIDSGKFIRGMHSFTDTRPEDDAVILVGKHKVVRKKKSLW